MISFRRLTPPDAALLSQVGGATLLQSHGHSAPAHIMQAYIAKSFSEAACRAELAENANIFNAVYNNGKPAGYSKIVFNCPHRATALQPVTKLERLYLLQEYHDLKLGHQLLQQAVDLSKAQGEQGMWLNVWKENSRAIRFYQKWGFETIGESLFVLTDTHANPNWVMLLPY